MKNSTQAPQDEEQNKDAISRASTNQKDKKALSFLISIARYAGIGFFIFLLPHSSNPLDLSLIGVIVSILALGVPWVQQFSTEWSSSKKELSSTTQATLDNAENIKLLDARIDKTESLQGAQSAYLENIQGRIVDIYNQIGNQKDGLQSLKGELKVLDSQLYSEIKIRAEKDHKRFLIELTEKAIASLGEQQKEVKDILQKLSEYIKLD